jgi:septal ring factor EnvC (AmiA/AmiB activator)
LKKGQEKLAALQQQAASYAKAGKPVPENLAQDIEEHRIDADSLKAEIDRAQTQIQAIKERYEADKRRYLELTQR